MNRNEDEPDNQREYYVLKCSIILKIVRLVSKSRERNLSAKHNSGYSIYH